MVFFSVITPSWNQGKFLDACVRSVLAQEETDFEHLVYDNCSTDCSGEVAALHPHVRYFSEPDRGQSHAVNKGFTEARGEVICWLNADDAYPPGVFTRLRRIFRDSAVDVVFGDAEQLSYDGGLSQRAEARFADRLDLVKWWRSDARLHQPAVFFRRKVLTKSGLLREDLHYAMDYEFWWRISEHFRFHYVPEVLAIQHRQPDSKTVRAWHKVYEERESVFAPFYGMVDGGNRTALLAVKRRELARKYLSNAYAAARHDRGAARADLSRAWREDPAEVLRPGTLGLLRRLLFGHFPS